MTAASPASPPAVNGMTLHRFSTDDYLQMIDAGVLGPSTRVELIDGIIVQMSPSGPPHHHVLMCLTRLFAPLFDRAMVSVQGTLVIAEGHVYDPDFMLLRKKDGGYKAALPRPQDVVLVIEASDTSLRKDKQIKLPVYAEAGIGEYWIADVDDESLIVHRQPQGSTYAHVESLAGDQTVSPSAFADFAIRVGDIFD